MHYLNAYSHLMTNWSPPRMKSAARFSAEYPLTTESEVNDAMSLPTGRRYIRVRSWGFQRNRERAGRQVRAGRWEDGVVRVHVIKGLLVYTCISADN
jgi:hypothetical protein